MLELKIESEEYFDESTSEFIRLPSITLKLEHSLLSISKWESKTHKRFLDKTEKKTSVDMLDYIRCMTLNHDVPDTVYAVLSADHMKQIEDYIGDSMSATTFSERTKNKTKRTSSGETISSELVYYWMTAFNIPFECEKWHFNRLMTLINICSIKNEPSKKMSKGSVMKQNAALNAARRKSHHSRG